MKQFVITALFLVLAIPALGADKIKIAWDQPENSGWTDQTRVVLLMRETETAEPEIAGLAGGYPALGLIAEIEENFFVPGVRYWLSAVAGDKTMGWSDECAAIIYDAKSANPLPYQLRVPVQRPVPPITIILQFQE